MAGGIILGMGLMAIFIGIFQFGLNYGIITAIRLIDAHPEAKFLLTKTKRSANVLPYIMGSKL